MTLSLIAALADNRLIGRDGDLPWRLPDDLRRFRRLTLGKTVLMGRRTWESLGKPLDQRQNWVLTRSADYAAAGARVFGQLETALATHAIEQPQAELMVIGGAELYRQTLAQAGRLYLTEVHAQPEGDTYFPEFDAAQWRETEREDFSADERHAYPYSFVTLVRQ